MLDSQGQLRKMFTYHPPQNDQVERYQRIRDAALAFAGEILSCAPESAERTLAIRDVQRASMMANAAIAIHEAD
jgi:hypothetical protein